MTRLTFLLAFGIGLAIGVSLCKRKPPQTVEPVQDEDRFNMADLPNRVREYDAKFNLERKRGKP